VKVRSVFLSAPTCDQASQLFPTSGYGSEVVGPTIPTTDEGYRAVFDRAGALFSAAFRHARRLGVLTATGTELPLGLEPGDASTEVGDDWVRGMPDELQARLSSQGLDPKSPDVVQSIYRGIFERINRTHPLDYYWVWSYEIWSRGEEGGMAVSQAQIDAMKTDMGLALAALDELGNPFQLAHAAWRLGTVDDPAAFDQSLPPEVPMFSLLGSAIGYDSLSAERVKWPGTWLEFDWGITQPQIATYRLHEDAVAALSKGGTGLIAEQWRTTVMGSNINGLKDLVWARGSTGSPPSRDLPPDAGAWMGPMYEAWASRQFGPTVAARVGELFSGIDWDSIPQPVGWDGDGYESPGVILANAACGEGSTTWPQLNASYSFVDTFESLESEVVGTGNRARFSYWLKTMQGLRLIGEFGCVRGVFEAAMNSGSFATALEQRTALARLFERIITLLIERIVNVSDLGEIINHEIVTWKGRISKFDSALATGLGYAIPAGAAPSLDYTGAPVLVVTTPRTHAYAGEATLIRAR